MVAPATASLSRAMVCRDQRSIGVIARLTEKGCQELGEVQT